MSARARPGRATEIHDDLTNQGGSSHGLGGRTPRDGSVVRARLPCSPRCSLSSPRWTRSHRPTECGARGISSCGGGVELGGDAVHEFLGFGAVVVGGQLHGLSVDRDGYRPTVRQYLPGTVAERYTGRGQDAA